jgi:hypothetical protein
LAAGAASQRTENPYVHDGFNRQRPRRSRRDGKRVPDANYLSHFYDPDRGGVILNPFDPDAVKWNLLGEITSDQDVD